MSRIFLSRLAGAVKKNFPARRSPFSSSPNSNSPSSSSTETLIAAEQPIPPPRAVPASRSRTVLKYSASFAFAAAIGTLGYASYAYDIDDLERKESSLREFASHFQAAKDASGLDKFQDMVYSSAFKVPLKTIELYIDARRWIEENVRGFTEPSAEKLLPDLHPQESHVFTLVLDLNETLVYSDWKRERGWRTFKRPGVDAFLEHLAKFYEVVVYSDQLSMYVDPIIERLDQKGCIRYRLARNATRYQDGKHYRDLSKLNRDPSQIIYISGHCLESTLQPENCVPIKPWKLENDDTALLDLIPFLEYVAVNRPADIRPVLASYQGRDIATEFIERSKEHQRRMQEQKQHGRFWRR